MQGDPLQAVLDHTHVQIAYLDPQFNFLYVNAAYARGSGYDREALIGRNHFDLFPHEENRRIFARVRDSGEMAAYVAKPFVFPNRPELGITYWDWTLVPIKDAGGAVEGVLLSLVDVTEREQMRQVRDNLATRLQVYADRLRLLHEADRAILEGRSIEETATGVLERLCGLVSPAQASVTLFDLEQGQVAFVAVTHEKTRPPDTGWRGPLDTVWFLDRLRQGEAYRVDDLGALPDPNVWARALRADGVGTLLCLPLIAHGELIGSLNLGLAADGRLLPDDDEIIREIARELAVALQQTRLLQQLQEHSQELEALVERRTVELRSSEARFRSIFDESPIGIVLCSLDGRIAMSNPGVERMTGYSQDEVLGRNLARFVSAQDASAGADLWQRIASGRESHYHAEQRLVRKDGHTVATSWTASLMQQPQGRSPLVLVTVEDVTEQKQAQAALVQAEKLAVVGRLSASLTHELSNPMQSVMGCLGLAAEALASGRSAERYLDVARVELRRAADIVSRLRDMLRRPRAQDKEPADVGPLMQHVLTLVETKCADRRIGIASQVQPDLPQLMAARDQIIQVLLNVVLNAIDAMPGGGLLRLEAEATSEPAGVTLTVADTGQGMSREGLAHLFEPFYTTKSDGVGLGLYVSRNIVEDHGGRIDVTSEPGQGSTFRIWLPV